MTKQDTVIRQLAALQRMGLDELCEKHVELFGEEPKVRTSAFLRSKLAYRIQEIHFGGLTEAERLILGRLAENDPVANLASRKEVASEVLRGTKFRREWHGVVHEVLATGDGKFEYMGMPYKSLSAVAKVITGVHWNGKLFFGLKG